jgi:hypothetical protein
MAAVQDLRDCRLYRFWVRHPVTGERVLGYIGETVRQPLQRLIEHLYEQPWADTIIAWEVDEVIYPGKAAVLEAERLAVERELPLYNHEWNLGNPRRVKIWRAKEQRWARDDRAGQPRWVLPVKRPRAQSDTFDSSRRSDMSERSSGISQWPTPILVKICLWSISWAVATSVSWGVFQRNEWLATGRTRLLCASTVMLVVLVLARWLTPSRRREVVKGWRRVRKWLR